MTSIPLSSTSPQSNAAAANPKSIHLLNPLLDSIFNNPSPNKSTLKPVIDTLSRHHNDYTILVPPALLLQTHNDPNSEFQTTKTRLRELCYTSEDFIKSHILKTSHPISSKSPSSSSKLLLVIYNTLNGKQILIKNGMIFPGKGFGKSLTIKILKIDYFYSVCKYFPQGSNFMIMYINQPTVGSYFDPTVASHIPTQVISADQTTHTLIAPAGKTFKSHSIDTITFEKLLRSFPLLSKAVSDKYYHLFHHNNYQFQILRPNKVDEFETIQIEFNQILENLFKIVQDCVDSNIPNSDVTFELINNILKTYPGLDFNKLIHEYVELNLYDKVWTQLLLQFTKKPYYDILSNLTLNQLDISVVKPWQVNELNKRILLAIEEFKMLNDSSIVNLQSKTKVLIRTIEYLTRPSSQTFTDNVIIDADTLIGLFMMVIVHSRMENLEAHLYYIKHFNYTGSTPDEGYLNYILSNFDAVLFHLNHSILEEEDENADEKNLVRLATENKVFWNLIDEGNINGLVDLFYNIQENDISENHFLRSKTVTGESCLMRSIKGKNFEIFKLLLEYNPDWFSIDDILFDKNIQYDQTLLMTSIIEECDDITNLLIEIIELSTCTEEQIAYYNCQDILGRTIGHYLHHNIDLIDRLGPLINWELKDLQSHTPLFSLCRCYDHPKYSELISKSFDLQKGVVSFDAHIDRNGNTLLHVIQRDLDKAGLLSEDKYIDINQFNHKNLTPLSLYVKYNRIENLKEILRDSRVDFKIEDSVHFYNVFDYSGSSGALGTSASSEVDNFEVDKLLTKFFFDDFFEKGIKHKIVSTQAKFDQASKDWLIVFKKQNEDESFMRFSHSMEYISQNMYLLKLQYPNSIFPLKDKFFQNFPPLTSTSVYPMFNKFKVNRFIETLNIFLLSLNYHPKYCMLVNIWERFDIDQRKKLMLDLITTIKISTEMEKNLVGDVKLNSSKIQEIEFFLNFSMNDLLKFKSIMWRFNKMINLMDWKLSDFKLVFDGFLHDWNRVAKKPLEEGQHQEEGVGSEYRTLLQFTTSLFLFVSELTDNVSKTIDRLNNWKQLHSQIVELNGEITKYENSHVTNTLENGNHDNNNNTNTDSISSFFNFSLILESKETKYKKLLTTKAEVIKKIMNLNVQIKLEHEALAAEISAFLKYKSDFLYNSLKVFGKVSVTKRKKRKYELEKFIHRLRS